MELGFLGFIMGFIGLGLCVRAYFKQKEHNQKFPADTAYDPLTRAGRSRSASQKKVLWRWVLGAVFSCLGVGLGIAAAAIH